MKKILSYILVCCTLMALMSGCAASTKKDGTQVQLAALTGPTAICMAGIFKDIDEGDPDVNYAPRLFGSADELVPLILQGEIDIASLPLNLASVLYNKTGGDVVLLCADVLGVLYIGEYNSQTVNGIADLRGKTLYATGKGAVPEVFLRYILSQNGIDPDSDVQIEWKSEPNEVVALLNAHQSGIAMLPQPYATAAAIQLGEGYRNVISISDEWDALDTNSACITAGVAVRREFLEAHPDIVDAFLDSMAESVKWVNENPADAAVICETMGFAKAPVIEKAIPACNLVCMTGKEMAEAVSGCLKIQLDFSPASVGGALPDKDFYYEKP